MEGGLLVAKFMAGLGIVVACSLLLRGASRWRHPMYATFMEVLLKARSHYNQHTKVSKATPSLLEFDSPGLPTYCLEAADGVRLPVLLLARRL